MTYGMKTNVGINFQNSYGTPLTTSIYWLPFLSEDLAVKKPPLISQGMRGVFDEGAHYEGANSIDSTIEMEAHPILLGVLLKAMCGAPSTVTSGSVYTHTFKPRTSDFDAYAAGTPLNIVKDLGDTGSAHQYYDVVGTKLSLSIANGEFLKSSLSVMGGKYSQIVAPAASYPTQNLYTWDVTSVSIAAAANGDIKDINVEVDDQLENHYTLNASKFPSRTKRSNFRTVSIGGTIVFDNQTEYQQFLSQSERNLTVCLKRSTEIQSGYTESFTMILPLARHIEFAPVADGPGKLEVGFSSKGVYSVTSATALAFVLVNTQAAY